MADYIESLLADNEKIVMNVKQHWFALIRFALQPILILIGAVVVGAISVSYSGDDKFLRDIFDTLLRWLAIGLLVVAVVWLPIQIVRWMSRRYVLTSRRVIESAGVMRKVTTDAGLDKITDVGYQQGWIGKKLGFGDIAVVTAAGAPITLDQIIGALEFKKAIMDAQEALMRERAAMIVGGSPAAAVAAAAVAPAPQATVATPEIPTAAVPVVPVVDDALKAATPNEITATLAQLADAREAGTITDADYETKKQELLERL